MIIEKNPEALLQRVRLIRNAKEDIILSTFAFYKERVKIRTPYIICNDIMYNTWENIAESDSECFRRCICICILCYVLFVYVEQKGNRGDRR